MNPGRPDEGQWHQAPQPHGDYQNDPNNWPGHEQDPNWQQGYDQQGGYDQGGYQQGGYDQYDQGGYDYQQQEPGYAEEPRSKRSSIVWLVVAAVLCLVAAVTAGLTVFGGSDKDGDNAATNKSKTSQSQSGAKSSATSGSQTSSANVDDIVAFSSPSGNIGCSLSSAGARCDVREKAWQLPAKPSSCNGDWGIGAMVDATASSLVCGTDTTLGTGSALAYGSSQTRGTFTCTSSEAGVRCTNSANGHGFMVAKANYTLF